MAPDLPIMLLAAVIFVLLLLYTILRSLRMPPSFFEKQRQRDTLKREFLKNRILPPEELPVEKEN